MTMLTDVRDLTALSDFPLIVPKSRVSWFLDCCQVKNHEMRELQGLHKFEKDNQEIGHNENEQRTNAIVRET